MRRLDRARAVRDILLSRSDDWATTRVGDRDVASLEWRQVHAVLWSSGSFIAAPDTAGIIDVFAHRQRDMACPYVLDVWVRGSKVLSITWNTRDDIKLIRMLRGDWESDLFQLPPPAGKSRPTIH